MAKPRGYLKYVDWGVFHGLKSKSKMYINVIVWPYVSVSEKDQRRLLKAKQIRGKMLVMNFLREK